MSRGERREVATVNVQRARIKRVTIVTALAAVHFAAFQNCSEPRQVTKTDVSSVAESADLAYDAHFDQIAYMSCSELASGGYDESTYFTFRAGAYRTGGLQIKNDYFTSLEPALQRRLATDDAKLSFLMDSPANTGTQLQLSIRSISNFQAVFSKSGSAVAKQDFDDLLSQLGTETMIETLFNLGTGQRLRYMRNGSAEGKRFEGNIQMGSSTALQDSVRSKLHSDGMLALTYVEQGSGASNSKTYARGPALYGLSTVGETSSVFGKGYTVRFKQPTPVSGSIYGSFPNHVLASITELNLRDRSDTANIKSWTCPTTMQFRIVRPGDLNKTGANCNLAADPAVRSADLEMIRKSLREEDWYVDMANRCIVPKKYSGSCYGNITTVNYQIANACTPNNNNEQCVHYASICYRQE